MFHVGQVGRTRSIALVEDSPLRRLDPRVKLTLSLCSSLAVMLPLERLLVFLAAYVFLMTWARLLPMMLRQVWRMKWILVVLFAADWWLVGIDLAVIITLRLVLLAGTFSLLFSTTTASELGLALESIGLPYRAAFSLNLAFQSLRLLDDEWRAILEAQHARGIEFKIKSWRQLTKRVREMVALTVPAIVLTTRRAWALTEAAYARGFDSPHRQPFRRIKMKTMDWISLILVIAVILLLFWR